MDSNQSLLDEFIVALEQATDQEAVLEEFCRRHPEQAEQLRSTYRFYEQLGSLGSTAAPATLPRLSERRLPEKFGDFQILRVIDVGGMGVVYEALQLSLQRRVAIKTLRNPAAAPRFVNEQQCLAQFYQANIVPLYETGNCDGIPYLVMPFIDGAPLNKVVSAANRLLLADASDSQPSSIGQLAEISSQPAPEKPRPAGEAAEAPTAASPAAVPRLGQTYFRSVARCVADVARAIADSHRLNIVHRDLKPENVMVDRQGHAFIIDFGLASPPDSGDATTPIITSDGASLREASGIFGTRDYMAPEQFRGQFDRVTDVWGVGTILYELLSLRRAYRGTQRERPPRPPRHWNPRVPRDLEAIALKCLAHEPEDRYQSVAEVAEELERWLRHLPVAARPPGLGERLVKWTRRNAALAATLGFLLLGTLATLLGLVWHNRSVQAINTRLVEQAAELRSANEQIRQQERRATRYVYGSRMQRAYEFFARAYLTPIGELLQHCRADDAGTDLRGWEWYLLNGACQAERHTLLGHRSAITCVTYNRDGTRVISADASGTIRVWNRESSTCERTIEAHSAPIHALALNPDGGLVASAGGDGKVLLWRLPEWASAGSLDDHILPVVAVRHHPNRPQWVTASEDRRVILWGADGQIEHILQHAAPLRDVGYSPDGTQLVTASARQLSVWDVAGGQRVAQLDSPRKLTTASFTPAGDQVLCGCEPGSGEDAKRPLLRWDLQSKEATPTCVAQSVHSVHDLKLASDESCLVTAASDRMLRIYDLRYHHLFRRIPAHDGEIACVAWHPRDQQIVSGGSDGAVRLWDLDGGPLIQQFRGHALNIQDLEFSSDGRWLASCSYDHSVRLWDTTRGRLARTFGKQHVEREANSGRILHIDTFRGHENLVTDVAFSPDATRLASAGFDKTIRLWDTLSGRELARLDHRAEVIAACFSPDGSRLATASWDDVVTIWDVDTHKRLLVGAGHQGHINDIVYSPDGEYLASASDDSSIGIWNVDTGTRERTITGHRGKVQCLAYSADGQMLASGGDDWSVRVWDAATGEERLVLSGHSARVDDVAFHPTERRLASASSQRGDRTVRFWDLDLGQEVGHLEARGPIAFSPDGWRLALVGLRQTIEIWDAAHGKHVPAFAGRPVPATVAEREYDLPPDGGVKTMGYFLTDELPDVRSPGEQFRSGADKRYLVAVLSVPMKLLMPTPKIYQRLVESAAERGEPIADADRMAVYQPAWFFLRRATAPHDEADAAELISGWPDSQGMVPYMTVTRSERFSPAERTGLLVAWEVDRSWSEQFPAELPQLNYAVFDPVAITPRELPQ